MHFGAAPALRPASSPYMKASAPPLINSMPYFRATFTEKEVIKMVKIAPSILSADFARLGDEIRSIKEADYLHFDVMERNICAKYIHRDTGA